VAEKKKNFKRKRIGKKRKQLERENWRKFDSYTFVLIDVMMDDGLLFAGVLRLLKYCLALVNVFPSTSLLRQE
jgi:hypothetical protein